MTIFQDTQGRKWNISINVGTAMRCKSETDVDLMNAIKIDKDGIKASVFDEIAEDPCKLVMVLSSLCGKQIQEQGMSPEDFACIFDADTIENASDALVREIINFSQPVKRKVLTLLYGESKKHQEKVDAEIMKALDGENMQKEIQDQLSRLSSNTQESAE